MRGKKRVFLSTFVLLCILACSTMTVFASEEAAEYVPDMYATFWSLIPPIVAIALALITKEVYSSLFVGILHRHPVLGVCGKLTGEECGQAGPLWTTGGHVPDFRVCCLSGISVTKL